MEGGTFRNLINHRNISASSNASGHVNEKKDFLELTTKAHLVAAALHFFAMASHILIVYQLQPVFHLTRRKICFIGRCYSLLTNMLYQVRPIWVSITDISNNPHLKHITSEHSYSKKKATWIP